jgi:hypothetical protein
MRNAYSRSCISIAAIVLVAALVSPNSSLAAGGALSDKMGAFNYFISGSWKCSTKVPAVARRPARTQQGTNVFDATPGNTLHSRVSAAGYSRDRYYGYNSHTKLYWTASVDNQGTYGYATSTDGVTYTGSSSFGGMNVNVKIRNTLVKTNPNQYTSEEVLLGGPKMVVDTVCTR